MSSHPKKVAVVTGGAQGIGYSIAEKLLIRGFQVIICDINQTQGEQAAEKLNAKYGTNCSFVETDVSDVNAFERILYGIKDKYKQIHVLVNNAAFIDDTNWEREIDVNIKGTILGCQVGMKVVEKGGTIVNTSSTTAASPYTLMPIYSMTKAAILHLTTTLGSDAYLNEFEVRVIAILPGMTLTPALDSKERRYFFPEISKIRNEERKNLGKLQTVGNVADCFIQALDKAKNGSLWVSRENKSPEILEVKFTFTEAQ